jgi:DNA polymerase-3 subunit delta
MKIQPARIEGFVSTISKSAVFSVLIYGPDSGGTSNLANKIATQIVQDPTDPFSTAVIDNEKITTEPTAIFDEMSAISFFGGRKLVLFKNADSNKDVADAIESAIKGIPDDAKKGSFLIVTAGDLPPTSPLRKLYEFGGDNIAALACYVEDERDLTSKINRLFSQRGLRATERGAIEYLASACQGDSKIIESEIEKLDLYLDGKKEVSLEDVLATTGNSTETDLQDICDLVCSNKKTEAEVALRKAMDAGLAPIAIIRSLQRYIEKLHYCANQVQQEGKSAETAIAALKPPMFFKQVPTFKNHLNLMLKKPANDIWGAYSALYDAESELKESGSEPELITSRAIAKIL